jgi:very-short-patch-repair endonuclease
MVNLRLSSSNHSFQKDELLKKQLQKFQDKLLEINQKNRSLLLRKIIKKWNFDLAQLNDEGIFVQILERAILSGRDVHLLSDSLADEPSVLLRDHLAMLARNSKLIEEDSGIHDLYIGFPFVRGRLNEELFLRAPLILFAVELEHKRDVPRPGWYLSFSSDQPLRWNRTLFAAIYRSLEIPIPSTLDEDLDNLQGSVSEDKKDVLMTFLQNLAKLLQKYGMPFDLNPEFMFQEAVEPLNKEQTDTLRESLRVQFCAVLGIFRQAENAIYNDYEYLKQLVAKGDIDLGILGKILGIPDQPNTSLEDAGEYNNCWEDKLDQTKDEMLNAVLDSDASQDAVLLQSQDCECVVVRGPPGTGKSQVIVNLISNSISKGERVALVCQKRAALEVVRHRLGEAGLSSFAVFLEDEKKDRSTMYAQLHRLLSGQDREHFESSPSLNSISNEIDQTIRKLNEIVKPLNKQYFGTKPYVLYSNVDPDYKQRLDLQDLDASLDANSLEALIEKLDKVKNDAKKFSNPSYPFRIRTDFSRLSFSDKEKLRHCLESIKDSLKEEYLSLKDKSEYDNAIQDLDAFCGSVNKRFRFLDSAWRNHGKRGEKLILSRNLAPNVESARLLLSLAKKGRKLIEEIGSLEPFLSAEGVEGLIRMITDRPILSQRISSMLDAVEDFDILQKYDQTLSTFSPVEKNFLSICVNQLRDDEDWKRPIRNEVPLRWIERIEKENPVLAVDPLACYKELRDKLEELFKAKKKALSATIRSKIESNLPRIGERSSRSPDKWNSLDYEFTKTRRILPVRQILEKYEKLMQYLTPCWLLSPEMMSAIIPLTEGYFDVIIFDEASQLSVERSIPAMYRAKRIVVAGDEKQLPPFDLFFGKGEEDETDEDIESYSDESLLQMTRKLYGFNYLKWHYRSEYQELIDFSNFAFYDGQLQVVGNNIKHPTIPPIKWVECNGRWEENRTNDLEAKRVVDEVEEILKQSESEGVDPPSIGIVTFNDPQRDLIQRLIEKKQENADFFRMYTRMEGVSKQKSGEKRQFVRNIENVQGEQADIIIFSVGYAKDNEGRLRTQFGLLNVQGGENRLNVAITRAIKRIIVCCSFNPDDLEVENSSNRGPKLLKLYLQYAKAVSENDRVKIKSLLDSINLGLPRPTKGNSSTSLQFESHFEEQVYNALRNLGYTLDAQVGFSGYRIDLAVVHPKDPNRYVLAIECDGAMFHSAKSARERDLVRERFLKSKGWKVERVWSRNWWRNRQVEIQRLEKAIEAAASKEATIQAQ